MDTKLNELRKKIRNEIPYVDVKPYSHNIISLLLSQISKDYGNTEANKTIEDYNLEKLGWEKVA